MNSPMGRGLFCLAAAGLSGLLLFGQQVPPAQTPSQTAVSAGPFRGSGAQFRGRPFPVGGLTLTFGMMIGNLFQVRIDNERQETQTFHPGDLVLVDATGCTLEILECNRIGTTDTLLLPVPCRLAPGTYATRSYCGLGSWKAPYKVYFQDNLLAEVTD